MSKAALPKITFTGAEIKKLGVKKLVSLDKEYEVIIRTADPMIMNLDMFDPLTTFKVSVEVE